MCLFSCLTSFCALLLRFLPLALTSSCAIVFVTCQTLSTWDSIHNHEFATNSSKFEREVFRKKENTSGSLDVILSGMLFFWIEQIQIPSGPLVNFSESFWISLMMPVNSLPRAPPA